jgi:hypothetical protein
VSRSLLIVAAAILAAVFVVTPALARPHVVAQRSSIKNSGTVTLIKGLLPGHRYRLQVRPGKRTTFKTVGFEHYTYFQKGLLGERNSAVHFSGTAPGSVTFGQPVNFPLSSWALAVNIKLGAATHLTVRLVDLGRQK